MQGLDTWLHTVLEDDKIKNANIIFSEAPILMIFSWVRTKYSNIVNEMNVLTIQHDSSCLLR